MNSLTNEIQLHLVFMHQMWAVRGQSMLLLLRQTAEDIVLADELGMTRVDRRTSLRPRRRVLFEAPGP